MMLQKQRILIVDDNPDNIRLAADSLKDIHASLCFATSGAKALEILSFESVDLILMDIMMPEMDGFETVKRIKNNPIFKSIPIIFITAINDQENTIRAFQEGGVDYITKPFNPEELRARAATHLELRRLNKDLREAVEIKTKELQESMLVDQSTRAYNASKLTLDLAFSKYRVGTMIHIRNIHQLELAFGLEAVEKMLATLVQWLKDQHSIMAATIYRITFADFVCLFESTQIEEVEQISQELLKKLDQLPIEILPGNPISLNLVLSIADGDDARLITHLRIAQMEAEAQNLGCYRFQSEGMQVIKQQEKNLQWMQRLKESFQNDLLVPYYQPIVDIKTGKTVRYECLARIKEGEEVISPWHFIEAAKQLGAITEITKRMITKSCRTFSGTSMGLSVNITKEDLMEGYLSNMLQEMCSQHTLSPSQITLEVLEEISVFGNDHVVTELLNLKNLGYKVALDDFGSENASFSRMLNLEIDLLKIDGMFIKNIHQHDASRLIVEGIAYLAKLFRYDVVAEFVHNQEVLDMVSAHGIQYAQGYHFSPPLETPKEL